MYNVRITYVLICILALYGCGNPASYVVRGLDGKDGDKGDSGANGTNGSDGASGVTGPTGPQGVPGSDADSITIVKLCPAVTTYPSTFTEIAFCIQGKLYATYSANGGFSTEIPPGNYSSNGINSSCSFKVKPNCIVEAL